jgi:GTP-binding protein EngB required for normal cell division
MGQTKSKDSADTEGTDNLSAEFAINDIDILRRLTENEGPIAMSAYIDARLNRWKKEQVKFAITGRSATGKSTFINTIRNIKPGDDGFAKSGSGETTITPTLYIHPTNDQITFYYLPGYSSTTFKKEDYISKMKISDYHFVFLFLTTSSVKMRYDWKVKCVGWVNRSRLSGQRST